MRRSLHSRFVGAASLCAALFAGALVGRELTAPPALAPGPALALSPAAFVQDDAPAPLPPVTVTVDGERALPADPDALSLALPTDTADSGPAPAGPAPDWRAWARLDSARASVVLSDPDAPVGVYASLRGETASVLLHNRAGQRARVRLLWRLSAGAYRFERLSLSPGPDLPARFERLTGQEASLARPAAQPLTLEPGQTIVIRATDTARLARAARLDVHRALDALNRRSPVTASRIRRTLAEARWYLGALSGGGAKRAASLHRLLLYVAKAQSVARNLPSRTALPRETLAELADSLDRFAQAVSDTSATLLRLTARIEDGGGPGVAGGRASGTTPRLAQDAPATVERALAVSLTNGGRQSVGNVKLGLDPRSLPEGVTARPDEPAFFGELRPGQTVRAEYRLRGPADRVADAGGATARVSYFVGGTPALLRPTLGPRP